MIFVNVATKAFNIAANKFVDVAFVIDEFVEKILVEVELVSVELPEIKLFVFVFTDV